MEIMGCPWCGEIPKFYQTPHGYWWLECENYACPVQPMSQAFSRKDKLVRKWNERWKDDGRRSQEDSESVDAGT